MAPKEKIVASSLKANTKISTRLAIGFSTLLCLLVGLVVVGIYQVNQIDRDLTTINDVNGTKLGFAVNMRGSVHDRAIALRDIVLTQNDDRLDALLEEMNRLDRDYADASEGEHEVAQEYSSGQEERALLESIDAQAATTLELTHQVVSDRQAGQLDDAETLLREQAGPAYAEWLNRINQFIGLQEQLNDATTANARDTASGFQMQMLGLTLFALLLGGGIAYWLTRQLLRELGAEPYEVKAFTEAIGRGELTIQGRLKRATPKVSWRRRWLWRASYRTSSHKYVHRPMLLPATVSKSLKAITTSLRALSNKPARLLKPPLQWKSLTAPSNSTQKTPSKQVRKLHGHLQRPPRAVKQFIKS